QTIERTVWLPGPLTQPTRETTGAAAPQHNGFMRDWRRELAEVARERFVPDTIWLDTGTGYVPLRRPEDPVAWRRHVAADQPIVIQVDDGNTPPGTPGHAPSSSTSQPSVVAL